MERKTFIRMSPVTNQKVYRLGEIDVLVFFADRAMERQAKSKQLTLESSKGNERKIRDDFKEPIQILLQPSLQMRRNTLSRRRICR